MGRTEIARWLNRAGADRAVLRLRSAQQRHWLTVLTYHRVFEAPASYPFDKGVIDANPRLFDEQLAVISRNYSVISCEHLLRHIRGEQELPPNPVLITFDDGYLDNYEVALPILRRRGLPATFFIATSFIEERRIFWWDRISYALAETRVDQATLPYPTPLVLSGLQSEAGRAHACSVLQLIIQEQYGLDHERLLNEMMLALEVPWDRAIEARLADEMVMSWDQVRALRDGGMDVQSHTRSHRTLHTVPRGELADELGGARKDLERELGAPVHAISYPVGRSLKALSVIDDVRKAGYELAFTNGTGVNYGDPRKNALEVRRVAMDTMYSSEVFSGMMALPMLFYGS